MFAMIIDNYGLINHHDNDQSNDNDFDQIIWKMKFLVLDDRDYIIISQGGGGATISCIILIFIIIILLYPRVEEVEVCRLPLELHEIASQA